jgi:NAD(P)-dependent dehydrogenase (short-subunit alcohol dehydrogenase family)
MHESVVGHLQTWPVQDGMSASPLKADIIGREHEVRYGPEADIPHASQSLESAVIWRPVTLGVLGRGCPLARGRMRVKELAGKTAFVTGAASGIGLGIATAFAQAGAKVMLCDIEEAALSAALKQLRLTNVDVDGVKADVSLKAELVAAAEATTARYGKVHILVNNAGVGGGGPYGTWTEASWNWTMGVNLMATIWGIEIFGPLIEQHGEGGHIVSTASIAGLVSGRSRAYNVSKYGVVALSEGLRPELAPRGIGVSVLCPGFIRTQIINSRRNLPKRFEGAVPALPTSGPLAEQINMIRERVSQGIDPIYVGELVREGVEKDWPYIFTDLEFEPMIEARFAAIKQGFDQIRGRNPKR